MNKYIQYALMNIKNANNSLKSDKIINNSNNNS